MRHLRSVPASPHMPDWRRLLPILGFESQTNVKNDPIELRERLRVAAQESEEGRSEEGGDVVCWHPRRRRVAVPLACG